MVLGNIQLLRRSGQVIDCPRCNNNCIWNYCIVWAFHATHCVGSNVDTRGRTLCFSINTWSVPILLVQGTHQVPSNSRYSSTISLGRANIATRMNAYFNWMLIIAGSPWATTLPRTVEILLLGLFMLFKRKTLKKHGLRCPVKISLQAQMLHLWK
jgi:hypothetical protein